MVDKRDLGLAEALKYSHLGITFVITLGIFLLCGYFLDKWLGTSPWLFSLSVFPGLIAGIYLLYKELIIKKEKKSQNTEDVRDDER